VSEGGSVGEACEKEEGPEEWGKDEKEPVKSCPVVKGNLKITNHGAAEQIKDIQYTKKFGAGAFVHTTPLNFKLLPCSLWGWEEWSSRLYGMKNHSLLTKTFHLAHV
jgi:hypothetical protein